MAHPHGALGCLQLVSAGGCCARASISCITAQGMEQLDVSLAALDEEAVPRPALSSLRRELADDQLAVFLV